MAQQFYNISLKDTNFPMLSEQQGRTTIGSAAGKATAAGDKPTIAYCHNVMPSSYGMDSIGFIDEIPALVGVSFSDVRVLYGDLKSRMYIAWDTVGAVYALLDGTASWIAIPATVPATGGAGFNLDSVTSSRVNGISYLFYAGIGCFTYNEGTNSLDSVPLPGLAIPSILGLIGSSGYNIAYTEEDIAWSSTILATDFVPSRVTGAGGGSVAGIAGKILFITSNSLGILVYTSTNVIAGTYTGNARYPFKFREVIAAKGGITLDRIAYEANSTIQFVYSKAGLQAVTSQKAENILPEVTDFLAGKRFETYNETTKLYERADLSATETMLKKIKYIGSRYLIVSYGLPSAGFSHALVFDTTLNKLGKIKLDHVDVFEYIGQQAEVSKEAIGFLLSDGRVKLLDFSATANSSGVMILGKLQFMLSRFITILGIEVENVEATSTLSVFTQASLDGKTFTTINGTLRNSEEGLRTYDFRAEAKNHSLVFIGKFNTVTAEVRYTVAGRR